MLSVRYIHSLKCVIETRKYEMRQGPGWMNTAPADYGYIQGYTGADGDYIDCYIGPSPWSNLVYVVDQNQIRTPIFDEHKVMLGYKSKAEAMIDYFNGHSHGRQIFRAQVCLTIDEFKDWLVHGDLSIPIEEQ